ncbi:MAG: DUF423 domain-containing protein [Candidatus Thiodiazotropha sp. (ex Lucinoma kastoroae)]|nr:DUF423 domain-containing protein [Candidatus Thiodiazotropha sp. (ex Rostrolucina anterorostrata)]MCU7848955.1 DUF423 domain-containing protein [Candidatus Thiodiazotropha sp. (ex Lucinoma kastoroae)]MCU7861552.1 DUF423 domain-containing protein [Candidatus Thiodiazotropha sp. (ex Lucinoma kastoroae)]
MSRQFLIIAAMSGLLLVLLGAFGAHALETRIPSAHLVWWQKAVSYQGIHTLALFGTALLALQHPSLPLRFAGWSFITGILLFSGSLYLLALTGQRGLAMLTPIGGTAFIVGWFALVLAAWRLPR